MVNILNNTTYYPFCLASQIFLKFLSFVEFALTVSRGMGTECFCKLFRKDGLKARLQSRVEVCVGLIGVVTAVALVSLEM